MKRKITAASFLVGLAVGCSCTDRASKPDQTDETEERRLCVKNCDRKSECLGEDFRYDGVDPADTMEHCVNSCMDTWFGQRWAQCHAEALKGLTCETEAMCPQLYGPGELCAREKYPWSGCRADPELWAERECTYDKCLANECCADAPPPTQ